MKPLTRDAKLTHKQWAALWQLVYGDVKIRRLNFGFREVTQFVVDGRDITHLVSKLRDKGLVRYKQIGFIVTERGQAYL